MSALDIWLTIGGLTFATLLTRVTPLLIQSRRRLPPIVDAALRHAPACALAAIVVPDLVMQDGAIALNFGNPRLVAGAAAALVCAFTRGVFSTIAVGMLVYWGLDWLAPDPVSSPR